LTAAIVSALHVLAVALALGAVTLRGRALRGPLDGAGLDRLFAADNAWGAAAALLVATGVLRAFAGLEKGTAFYLGSSAFWLKMGLLAAVLGLETWPMLTFIGWRRRRRRGEPLDTSAAPTLWVLNHVQLGLTVAIVFTASFMARGFGAR
jgi:putative membrane protein